MRHETTELTLPDWNWAVLMLNQALLGSISPNFRLVELGFENGLWTVHVVLWEESAADAEEIDDVCDQFSLFLSDIRDQISGAAYADAMPRIVVRSGPLGWTETVARRTVFRMRV